MKIPKEMEWFCENSKALEKFSGQWVLFDPTQGIVGRAVSFPQALAQAQKSKCRKKPFVFHVPTLDECDSPLPALRHRR